MRVMVLLKTSVIFYEYLEGLRGGLSKPLHLLTAKYAQQALSASKHCQIAIVLQCALL